MDANQRVKLLKDNGDCMHCCLDHKTAECRNAGRVCGGGKDGRGCSKEHKLHSDGVVLLIMTVRTLKRGVYGSVFFDYGCTSNFIREKFAKQCGFVGQEETLSVTTLGGVVTDYRTVISYKCSLRDENGTVASFNAYGMESITGDVSKIDGGKLKQLFPHLSETMLHSLRRGDKVDVLIGIGHPSWHPERAEKAKSSGDFWIYRGCFGACVGGRHPDIYEGTHRSDNLFFVNHTYHAIVWPNAEHESHELEYCPQRVKGITPDDTPSQRKVKVGSVPSGVDSQDPTSSVKKQINSDSTLRVDALEFHPPQIQTVTPDEQPVSDPTQNDTKRLPNLPTAISVVAEGWIEDVSCHDCVICGAVLTSPFDSKDLFFQADSLGTTIEPKCGGCKCSKCPIPGSKYSFQEQREYDIINNNLFRKGDEKRWYTSYPWQEGRHVLPKNDKSAFQSLLSLEKMLRANPEKAAEFCREIDEMVDRGAAIPLSEEELDTWDGAYHYLPMVLVKGKKRSRVCFDAARNQCGYPAFNKHLYKGPDRFLNNLLGVIIGFRNGRVGAAADLSKFHNQVYLVEEDVHMQRFYWRKMNKDIPPQTYAVRVNNFGVKSANCIATCALHKSADTFAEVYPVESTELKEQTYIDDELIAARNMEEIRVKTSRMDEICEHAGMTNKGWIITGDNSDASVTIGGEAEDLDQKVLGLSWSPSTDKFSFNIVLRFKVQSKEVEVTCMAEFLAIKDTLVLTRRMLSSNVARIFDPVGLLCPIILQSKILMRELWNEKDLGWDDPIPMELSEKWLSFLSSLLSLEDVKFPRSLWPDEEVEGLPILVIFSDGSLLAFGAVAYIRWKLKDGGYWTRIIMAKCKIATS